VVHSAIADQVAKEIRRGSRFKDAVLSVLKSNGIERDYDEYFSDIGKMLSRRRSPGRGTRKSPQIKSPISWNLPLAERIRDAERICRLRGDEFIRDP